MRKLLASRRRTLAVCWSPGSGAPPPGPTDGFNSDNVEYVGYVPFEAGTATGAKAIGKYFYVTSWKDFSIYDISDPEAPTLLSKTLFVEDTADQGTGFRFENEDVATNGRILVFSQQLPVAHVFVYDIEDKTNPVLIGHLTEGGAHTSECLLDCKWLYGSNGNIIDLRDPDGAEAPRGEVDRTDMPATGSHDVNEVAPGLVLTSSRPVMLLDARKDPRPSQTPGPGRRRHDHRRHPLEPVAQPGQGQDRDVLERVERLRAAAPVRTARS